MKFTILLSILTISLGLKAGTFLDDHLRTQNWNGIDIVWLEDNTMPTYDVIFYFDGGAALDPVGKEGITDMSLNLLTLGTPRRFQGQIIDFLEFYGASYGASVSHEYSTYHVSGLVKDIIPTVKLVCELFSEASYPNKELKLRKRRAIHAFKNLVTKPSRLASRIFRQVSLEHTPYARPTDGTMKTLKNISPRDLIKQRELFNNKVRKTIYLRGPKQVLNLKNVVKNDCGWDKNPEKSKHEFISEKGSKYKGKVVFVPIPKSNQAQVRIGRTLSTKEANEKRVLKGFTANFLGSGFTSRLMQRLRVDKGLTYSVSAFAAGQRDYGRAAISTFTKNATIVELLKSIEEVITENSKKIEKDLLVLTQKSTTGNYLFSLESTSGFLQRLVQLDHIGMPYNEIYNYEDKVNKITLPLLQNSLKDIFEMKEQVITIVGSKSLIKKLRKAGYDVVVKNYKSFI